MEIRFTKDADWIVVSYEENTHRVPAGQDREFVTYMFRRFRLGPEEGYRLLDLFKDLEEMGFLTEFKMNN